MGSVAAAPAMNIEELQNLQHALTESVEKRRSEYQQRSRGRKGVSESEARLRRFYESGLLGVIYWNMRGDLTGSFTAPVLRPELQGATLRGGMAVALGLATGGIGALIPLLDFGTNKKSKCAALVSQARKEIGVRASDMQPRKLRPAR
jgi:hypothetical protein